MRKQLRVRTAFHDHARIEDDDAVGLLHCGQAVRDDEGGAIAHQLRQRRLDVALSLGVERRSRFIEDQDRCILQQRARDGDALALPAGEQHTAIPHQGVESTRLAACELQHVCCLGRPLDGRLRHLTAEGDVIANGVIEQHHVLADNGDLFAQVRKLVLTHITAVDAHTGDPVVFDRHSGIDLVDAVAASTSNGFGPFPPYRIGENRYINGGYRRNENADLAAGYGQVLVLSPFGGRSRMPPEWGMDLATQVDELRAGGSRVQTVFPDGGAGEVFDANAMDPSTRLQAARGGYDQGRALAELLVGWAGTTDRSG